jgi:hypothetical protein
VAIRKPGKKIRLPPRMPAFIAKLPMIGEETERSKERRAAAKISGRREPKRELRYTEFATTEVLRTIEEARALAQAKGITASRKARLDEVAILEESATVSDLDSEMMEKLCEGHDEGAIFDDAALHLDLDTEIREVLRDYFVANRFAGGTAEEIRANLKKFRRRVKRFETALVKFLLTFPAAEDDLTEALNCELYGSDDVGSPDVQQVREDLEAMLKAAAHLREQEAGAGQDADRPKHQLAGALARIFEKHTGLPAGFGFSKTRDGIGDHAVCGPFAEFFKAVNEKIKDISPRDHVIGLETLIRPLT